MPVAMDPVDYPPLPQPDELSRPFWEGCRQHKLLIQRCRRCGRYIHTPRYVCRHCLSTELEPSEVSGRGTVDTFEIPLQPWTAYYKKRVPYVLAIVALEEEKHLKMVTNIVECEPEEVYIGMPVEVTFLDVTEDVTLPLFKPTAPG
jgi:uncharacterized OB-fold protein